MLKIQLGEADGNPEQLSKPIFSFNIAVHSFQQMALLEVVHWYRVGWSASPHVLTLYRQRNEFKFVVNFYHLCGYNRLLAAYSLSHKNILLCRVLQKYYTSYNNTRGHVNSQYQQVGAQVLQSVFNNAITIMITF